MIACCVRRRLVFPQRPLANGKGDGRGASPPRPLGLTNGTSINPSQDIQAEQKLGQIALINLRLEFVNQTQGLDWG